RENPLWRSRWPRIVVLPLPRKPVRTEIGITSAHISTAPAQSGDAHAVRRIARIERFPHLTKNGHDRDRPTLAAVDRDRPAKHRLRRCGVDPDILASSADHDCAIARALNSAGHAPGREALHHKLISQIDRSLAHRAAP